MEKPLLKLYITGHSARSESAIANLRRICQDVLKGHCEMVVIDILENPTVAEEEKILATPTLIKQFPPPTRRIIGDLSNSEKVLMGLGLQTFTNSREP